MDPFTLCMALSSLALAMKDLVNEQNHQDESKETDWFRKRLNKIINEIHESTGVSELILNEVTEKLDVIHSKLDQKNVEQDMMLSVLKSYIDNDVKQILEKDLCDQEKWLLYLAFHDDDYYKAPRGGIWLPEPNFEDEDLAKLVDEKYLRTKDQKSYYITRKGTEYVENGLVFISTWSYYDTATDSRTHYQMVSSNLDLLTQKSKNMQGPFDVSTEGIVIHERDEIKFERPNGKWTRLVYMNGTLDFSTQD